MENIICDITAFDYWRIPPIVQLLLAGDETDPSLQRLFGESALMATRASMASSPLCEKLLQPNPATRKIGATAQCLKSVAPLLAANHRGPVDILVTKRTECHLSSITQPRFTAHELPPCSTTPIAENISVTNPPFTLLQLAARSSLARTIMLATEVCGTFAIFKVPEPIKAALNPLTRNRPFPKIAGWEPFIDSTGSITDLWSRPALATPQELLNTAFEAAPKRGCENLRLAANLVVPNAASPFEARAGILLGLSRRRGGEGHTHFAFNKSIDLTRKAQVLAHRRHCVCDLYWEDGLDVECQSAMVHNEESSFLSDSDRTTALKHMGINVLPLTYEQLKDETRFEAFSETITNIRGTQFRRKTPRQKAATAALRSELFIDWETAHHV